jgi:hypothetical protein
MKYAIIGLGKIDTALIARPKIPTSCADFDEFSFVKAMVAPDPQ